MQSLLIENLTSFNLTRQEATIYVALLTHGQMTGYEVAKETGVARSNVYSSLQSLVEKGALYLIEGETKKYLPVEIDLFLKNRFEELKEKASKKKKNAPFTKQVYLGNELEIVFMESIGFKIRNFFVDH